MQSFVLEIVLTFLLMLVILSVSELVHRIGAGSVSMGAKEKVITAGIATGSVIALEERFAGPVLGPCWPRRRARSCAAVSLA